MSCVHYRKIPRNWDAKILKAGGRDEEKERKKEESRRNTEFSPLFIPKSVCNHILIIWRLRCVRATSDTLFRKLSRLHWTYRRSVATTVTGRKHNGKMNECMHALLLNWHGYLFAELTNAVNLHMCACVLPNRIPDKEAVHDTHTLANRINIYKSLT